MTGMLHHQIHLRLHGKLIRHDEQIVLDDTGKSLVLRKVAQQCQGQLKVMGSHLHKIGYIHEVKSAISEFMQYGIGLQEMEQLTEYARSRGALHPPPHPPARPACADRIPSSYSGEKVRHSRAPGSSETV